MSYGSINTNITLSACIFLNNNALMVILIIEKNYITILKLNKDFYSFLKDGGLISLISQNSNILIIFCDAVKNYAENVSIF